MNYDTLQQRPFGTNTALSAENTSLTPSGSGGAVGSQYRLQAAAYGDALRLLGRQARHGDAGAAMASIGLRDQANNSGFAPGTIQNVNAVNQAAVGRAGALEQRAADAANVGRLNRAIVGSNLNWINGRNAQGQQVVPADGAASNGGGTTAATAATAQPNGTPGVPAAGVTGGNVAGSRLSRLVNKTYAGTVANWMDRNPSQADLVPTAADDSKYQLSYDPSTMDASQVSAPSKADPRALSRIYGNPITSR